MIKYFNLFILTLIFLFQSCNDSELKYLKIENATDVQLSKKRFEKELFSLKEFTPKSIDSLKNNYPYFLPAFTGNIIQIGTVDDKMTPLYLQKFVTDPSILELYQYTENKWQDFDNHFVKLSKAFSRYHYLFPDKPLPEIITFISGFNYGIVVDSTYMGLGLDMFLGQNCKYYPLLAIPKYKQRQMNKANLVPSAIQGWLVSEFVLNQPDADLLSQMIHQGKIMFTLKTLLPDVPDSLIFGYTQKQLEWCEENEEQFWYYLVEENLLYNKDEKTILRFLGDAPFITGLPKVSPGRAGQWLGYRIVVKYMTKYPQTTIPQLFEMQDGKQFLIKSKYKP